MYSIEAQNPTLAEPERTKAPRAAVDGKKGVAARVQIFPHNALIAHKP